MKELKEMIKEIRKLIGKEHEVFICFYEKDLWVELYETKIRIEIFYSAKVDEIKITFREVDVDYLPADIIKEVVDVVDIMSNYKDVFRSILLDGDKH